MKRCPSCGQEVPASAATCIHCGSAVSSGETASGADDSRFAEGQVLRERYRLLERMGAGPLGEVWKAEVLKDGRVVAIRALPPGVAANPLAVAGIERQSAAAVQLVHENICRLYEFEAAEKPPLMVMEYTPGRTLAEVLEASPSHRLSVKELLPIARQVAAALDYAHGLSPPVLHRDIEPASISLMKDDKVKVMGFAVGHELKDAVAFAEGHAAVRHPYFVSPEEFYGHVPTVASEVYSFGATLYTCLAGRSPFDGRRPSQGDPYEPPPDIPGLPHYAGAVLRVALHKEPARRPPRASDLVAKLSAAAEEQVPAQPPPARPSAPRRTLSALDLYGQREPLLKRLKKGRPRRRLPVKLALILLALLLCVGGAGYCLKRSGRPLNEALAALWRGIMGDEGQPRAPAAEPDSARPIDAYADWSLGADLFAAAPPSIREGPPPAAEPEPAAIEEAGPVAAAPPPGEPPPRSAGVQGVQAGIGWGAARVGATREQVMAAFGQSEDNMSHWLNYRASKGIDVFYGDEERAQEVRFNRGFEGRLGSGVGVGSTVTSVTGVYGRPRQTREAQASQRALFEDRVLYRTPGGSKITYADRGLVFFFDSRDRVSQFIVFVPQKEEPKPMMAETEAAAPPAPEADATAAWVEAPAQAPAEPAAAEDALARRVTLTAPYPLSYPGAPTDRLSLQYAVQELVEQVGLQYDKEGSLASAGTVVRTWVRPNIVNLPCSEALSRLLTPKGLSYQVAGERVVLVPMAAGGGGLNLHQAAAAGDRFIVGRLLREGADPNEKDADGHTPLHVALMKGHSEVAMVLAMPGTNLEAKDPEGRTALHLAALNGDTAVVRHLLVNRAYADAEDARRQTPLHMAAARGHVGVVEELLRHEADVNAADFEGSTPLGLALKGNHDLVAHLLREHGAVE